MSAPAASSRSGRSSTLRPRVKDRYNSAVVIKKKKPDLAVLSEPPPPLVLRLKPVVRMTPDRFLKLCGQNRDVRLELTSEGDIVVMGPENSETGHTSNELAADCTIWARQDGTGLGFSSSAGFRLPNGAVGAPDWSWIRRERWESIPREDRRKFAPICPDFVLELRSPSDPLRYVQAKMQEYLDNGARLGCLIDPIQQRTHVYRPGAPTEILDRPDSLSGDPVLPGFVLALRSVWDR